MLDNRVIRDRSGQKWRRVLTNPQTLQYTHITPCSNICFPLLELNGNQFSVARAMLVEALMLRFLPSFGHNVHWRCLLDRSQNRGMIMSAENIIIIEALISGGKKKMKIAQKLISNSNLINFRRNINPSSQAGSWGVPNAMAEHRCLPSPIPRQCLWRSPSLRSQIEMLSFYAQSHTHSWIAKSPKLFALQSENVLQAIIST